MNTNSSFREIACAMMLVLLCALAQPARAAENMRFSGTFVLPGCTVTDQGGRINVEFKTNIGVERIDGEQYRQPIRYNIECPEAPPWRVKLTLIATETSFDPAAVQTSVPDLGIRILLDDKAFILNTPQSIQILNPAQPPRLEAVPVKERGSRLPETGFEAWALLVAELY